MRSVHTFSILPIADPENDKFVAWDVFFFSSSSKKLGVVRILNAYISFLVLQLPGLTIEQTLDYIQVISKKVEDADFIFKIRDDLRDSAFCNCEVEKYKYVEIFSRSTYYLNSLLNLLQISFKDEYYPYLNLDSLDPQSQIRLSMLQSPFRFTKNSTNFGNSKYILSTKYQIPFIGMIDIDPSLLIPLTDSYMLHRDNFVDITDKWILFANEGERFDNENISKCFIKNSSGEMDQFSNLVLASYDIETNNPGQKPDPTKIDQTLFNIGVGFFNPYSKKPFFRASIIIHDLANDPSIASSLEPSNRKYKKSASTLNDLNTKRYIVRNEYGTDDPLDFCEYICVNKEVDVIAAFIDLLEEFSPHLILSFNGYSFDDIAIWYRVKDNESLVQRFLQLFIPYSLLEVAKSNRLLIPAFKKIDLKLEGKTKTKDRYTLKSPFVQTIDVMFILKQADPKRFSSKFGLNIMLDSYNVKNPFNTEDKNLSKTGLKILTMFECWNLRLDFNLSSSEIALFSQEKSDLISHTKTFAFDNSSNSYKVPTEFKNKKVASSINVVGDSHEYSNLVSLSEDLINFKENAFEILNKNTGQKTIWIPRAKPCNLYQIAHYCCQDAWITGTLLIDRFTLVDKKYMAFATYTSLEDAIYRAVSLRVQMRINGDGYRYGFAIQDIREKDPLGLKQESDNTYVGGWVRVIKPGRNLGITALDANALYPSTIIALNLGLNSKVSPDVIANPTKYNLELLHHINLNDFCGSFHERWIFRKNSKN